MKHVILSHCVVQPIWIVLDETGRVVQAPMQREGETWHLCHADLGDLKERLEKLEAVLTAAIAVPTDSLPGGSRPTVLPLKPDNLTGGNDKEAPSATGARAGSSAPGKSDTDK